MRRAVFLDRDGTINVDHGFVARPDDLEFMPGAVEALRLLRGAGFALVVVTNQSGVARGYHTEEDVRAFHDEMNRRLAVDGARIDAFCYCPHHPEGTVPRYSRACECRKPGAALYRQAIADLDIDPRRSFAVGDKVSDIVPAVTLGATGILLEGPSAQALSEADSGGFLTAASLLDAARLVLGRV